MDGLIEAYGGGTQARGGNGADGAGDHGGLIGKDVTEHVLGDDHVKLAGILDDLHGAIVHQHIGDLYIGVLPCQLMDDLLPQAAGIQDVALLHGAELAAPLLGGLEADAADAADLLLAVAQNIRCYRLAVLLVRLVGAEVNAAGKLPDDDEINAFFHNLRL